MTSRLRGYDDWRNICMLDLELALMRMTPDEVVSMLTSERPLYWTISTPKLPKDSYFARIAENDDR